MAFIFGGNTPWTYEELKRQRELANMLATDTSAPRNVGEGLNAIGNALAYRGITKRAGKEEARMKGEFDQKWASVFGGYGGAAPAQNYTSPAFPGASAPPTTKTPADALGDSAMAALGKPPIHDHATAHPGRTHAEWLRYSNQNATRNDPLDPSLVEAMSFLPELGITMDVISGGQEPAGTPGGTRTGSTRHDHGKAADVDFYKDGRKLDWNNPADLPILQEIVRTAKSRGITGIGAGDDYMGAGRFHIGFGAPAVWGAGGSSANAPQWLVEAYNGAGSAPASPQAAAPQGGMNLGALVELAGDPMATPAQKAIVEQLIAQQTTAADPMKALELEKAQLEIERLRNPDQQQPDALVERRALLQAAGIDEASPEGQTYLLTGKMPEAPGASTTEYGTTLQFFNDPKDGSLRAGVIGKDGSFKEVPPPDGGDWATGVEKVDAGTKWVFINKRDGSIIGEQPKDLRGQEAEKALGKAEGESAGDAVTGLGNALAKGEQALGLIDQIANDPALPSILGIVQGNIAPGTPVVGGGQAGADLGAKIEQLQGQVFLEAFESLKGAGQITEIEGQKAERAKARLQRTQSPEAYREALAELRGVIESGMARAKAKAAAAGTAAPATDDLGLSEDDLKYLESP